MMHALLDQIKRLLSTILPPAPNRPLTSSQRRDLPPRIRLAPNDRKTRIRDVEAAVLVRQGCVRGCGDAEGVAADYAEVFEVDGAGQQWELVMRHTAAGLEVAPLRAVHVRPAAPLRSRPVVLLVVRLVVRGVALVLCLVLRSTRRGIRGVDVADVVQQWCCEFTDRADVAARREEEFGRVSLVRVWVEGGGGGEVAAVFGEGGVVDGGVPVAALPAADGEGDCLGEVVVVGDAGETEKLLECADEEALLATWAEEDVVDHMCQLLGLGDAVGGSVLADGFVVLPVVVDCFGDA